MNVVFVVVTTAPVRAVMASRILAASLMSAECVVAIIQVAFLDSLSARMETLLIVVASAMVMAPPAYTAKR